jgi:hypothetical protein
MLMPALATRMSRPPNALTVSAIMRRTWSPSFTSAASATARPPSPSSSASAAAFFASLRPAIATSAPARAKPLAMPRPMPPLPPVTSATLPLRSNGFMGKV